MSKQLVIFKVENENFGVEITQVKEIIKMVQIFKVPNVPEFVEGLINLRSRVYAIYNLRKKFNFPAADFSENTKIIIADVESTTIGFIVDEVSKIIRVEEENMEDTPRSVSSIHEKYLRGVAKVDNEIILILDLLTIVSTVNQEINEVISNANIEELEGKKETKKEAKK